MRCQQLITKWPQDAAALVLPQLLPEGLIVLNGFLDLAKTVVYIAQVSQVSGVSLYIAQKWFIS